MRGMPRIRVGSITVRTPGLFAALFVFFLVLCGLVFVARWSSGLWESLDDPLEEAGFPGAEEGMRVRRRDIKNDIDAAGYLNERRPQLSHEFGYFFFGGQKIDPRVTSIPDTRPLLCRFKVYDPPKHGVGSKNVSLILVYNDYEFYELRKTVESLLMSNSLAAVTEIIVVDDASSLAYIQEEARAFFAALPNTRVFRTSVKEPIGLARARSLAATAAIGDKLVFLASTAVVGNGWLDPLLKQLEEEPEALAVPHVDHLKDPVSMEYVPTPDDHTHTLTWSLSIRPFRTTSPEMGGDRLSAPLSTVAPALRGDVFAVRRNLFERIGGYDTVLEDYGGGEHVDLTLKAWLCGAGIRTAHCSRVAVVNSRDPVKVRSAFNRKRLTDVWFSGEGGGGEEFRSSVFRLLGAKVDDVGLDYPDANDSQDESIASFLSSLGSSSRSRCSPKRSVKWYVESVAVNMVPLRSDSISYGILKTGTNRCAHLLTVDDPNSTSSTSASGQQQVLMKVKLDECKPAVIEDPRFSVRSKALQREGRKDLPRESEFIFQLTRDGSIVVDDDFCLTTKENGYLVVERCLRPRDDKQRFRYENGRLINVWCGYCAMQVTDPNPSTPGDKQIAMVQTCDSYSDQEKSFKTWTFINL